MKLLPNANQRAVNVAEEWKRQYLVRGVWTSGRHHDTRQGYLDLIAKGETITAADVEQIIDNRSWTRPQVCSDCGCVDAVIQIGEPPDYESYTAYLCAACVQKAMKLIKELV